MKSPINQETEHEKQKHFAAGVQRRQSVELKVGLCTVPYMVTVVSLGSVYVEKLYSHSPAYVTPKFKCQLLRNLLFFSRLF